MHASSHVIGGWDAASDHTHLSFHHTCSCSCKVYNVHVVEMHPENYWKCDHTQPLEMWQKWWLKWNGCVRSSVKSWTNSKTCKWRINFRAHHHFLEKSQRLHAAENGTCRMLCVLYFLYFLYSVFSLKLTLCKIRPNLLEFLAVGLERVSIHSVVCQMTNWILHQTQASMGCGRGWGGQYLQH